MARTLETTRARATAAVVLTALALLTPAAAARAQDSLNPRALRDCRSADEAITAASPLPNVAAALQSRKTLRILTLGASPAAGRGIGRGGYTALIEQILEGAVKGLDVIMINRGVSGELAADAARRMQVEVALNEPDLVLWQVGTNDALAYVPVEDVEETVRNTVEWLRAHKVDAILVGLQFVNARLRDAHYIAVRDGLRELAAKENIIILRRDEAIQIIAQAANSGVESFPQDVERNEASYSCLAQYVARAITLGVFGKGLRGPQPQSQQPPPQ